MQCRLGWIVCALFAGLVFVNGPAMAAEDKDPAQGSLKAEFNKLATKLIELMEKEKQTNLKIGIFSPTSLSETINSGQGIEQALVSSLESMRKDVISDKAALEVKGDYAFALVDRNSTFKVVKITARIIDTATSDEIKELRTEIKIDATADIAKLLQLTIALPPTGNKQQRNEEIQKAINKQTVHIHGTNNTLITTNDKSPFSVEILVKNPGEAEATARSAKVENGLAFVEISKNAVYVIRLHNATTSEAAATINIDGIDVFHFSKDRNEKGEPKFTHFILAPGTEKVPTISIIPGWHQSLEGNENYLEFQVTENGKGAISKVPTAGRGKVGVITVSFAPCYPAGTKSTGETGFGKPLKVMQEALKRDIDVPNEIVNVRYVR